MGIKGGMMFTHNILDITIEYGDNACLSDITGKRYIDFGAGIFSASIGHSNKAVTEAISKGMADAIVRSNIKTSREKTIAAIGDLKIAAIAAELATAINKVICL